MKKWSKRLLSMLLSAIILIGVMPTGVFAVENPSQKNSGNVETDITGASGMGLILNNLEQTNTDENNSGCIVDFCTVNGKTANVQFTVSKDCKLVVAIYSDDDQKQMLGSGITDVKADQTKAQIQIDIPTMPEYYLIKVFMLNNDLSALSSNFSFFEHTTAYEQFMSVTPEDFDADRIVEFGENVEDSFGALDQDVVTADYTSSMEIDYDEKTGTYTFTNAISELKSLQIGDVFYYEIEDEYDVVLLKVKEITVTNNTVVIVVDDEISLDDAFDYMRYDEGIYTGNTDIFDCETGDAVDSVSPVEVVNEDENSLRTQDNEDGEDQKGNQSINFSYSIDYPNKIEDKKKSANEKKWASLGMKIQGTIGVTLSANTRLHWDIRIGPDYFEFKVEKNFDVSFDLSIIGELKIDSSKNFYKLKGIDGKDGIPLGKTGLFRLYFRIYPIAEVKLTVDALKFTISNINTTSINSEDGFNKSSTQKKWFDGEPIWSDPDNSKIEVKIGFGVEIEVGRKWGKQDKNGNCKVEATVGVSGDFYLDLTLVLQKRDTNTHNCRLCLAGDLDFVIEVNVSLKIKIFNVLSKVKTPKIKSNVKNGLFSITATIANPSYDLADFYIGWNSRGKFIHGSGKCPNIKTTVTVLVYDKANSNEPIKDAEIKCEGITVKTDAQGKALLYLTPGKNYTVTATTNGVTQTNYVNVAEMEKEVTFMFDGTNVPSNPSGNTSYSISGGTLTISGTGDMKNYSGFGTTEWDSKKDTIKKVIINSGVTSLGDYAFAQLHNLETVTIHSTVTKIGTATFYECNSLQTVTLPSSVKTLGDYAFYNCYSMSNFSFGDVEQIGNYTFAQCNALTNISLPKALNSVGDSAFAYCNNLKSVTINNKNCAIYSSANTIPTGATIYGGANSTAQKYANQYGKNFVSITVQDAGEILTKLNDSYTFSFTGGISGNDYILLNVTGYGTGFTLSTSNLEYIDQLTADSSGKITSTFIPRKFQNSSTTLLIGDFGNGTQTKVITPSSNSTTISIVNNPGTKTINYREGIALTASVQNPVDGIEIQWYVNGEPYSTGENFIYNAVKFDLNVEVKIVNRNLQPILKDGNEISASETVKVKAGFWQRLIAFFKFTIFHIKVIKEN